MTPQCVQVKLDLGHKATIKKKHTAEGFTHDWVVFVRGAEGSKIEEFVEKVVFNLHDSFPKPRRSFKSPPYQLAESGYAGFLMRIDIYFRAREDPKKVTFEYDLFLQIDGPPVSNVRCEKLTFTNPNEEFKEKLLTAGAVIVESPELSNPVNVPIESKSPSPISSNLSSSSSPPMNFSNGLPSSGGSAEISQSSSDSKRKPKSSNGESSSSKKIKLVSGKHKSHSSSSSSKHSSHNSKSDSSTVNNSSYSKSDQNGLKFKSSGAKSSPKSSKKPKDETPKKFHINSFIKSPKNESDTKDNVRTVSVSTQKENKAHREKVGSKSVASSVPAKSNTPEKSSHKRASDSKSSGKSSSSSEKHKKKFSHHDKSDSNKKKIKLSESSNDRKTHNSESTSSNSHKKKRHKHKHQDDLDKNQIQTNGLKTLPVVEKSSHPSVVECSPNPKVKISSPVSLSADESKNCAINSDSGNDTDYSFSASFSSNYPWERIEKMVKILNESTHSEFLCEVVECILDSAQKYEKTNTRFEVELGQMDQNCMDRIVKIFEKFSYEV